MTTEPETAPAHGSLLLADDDNSFRQRLALTLIGSIRELVGNGSIFGISLLGASYQPMLLIILPAGGFLVFGSLLGIINAIGNKRKKGAKA